MFLSLSIRFYDADNDNIPLQAFEIVDANGM